MISSKQERRTFSLPPRDGMGGIVLDAVGTLIAADPGVAAVYTEAAARQGVSLDVAVVAERFAAAFNRAEDRLGTATDEATELLRWKRIVAEVLPEVPEPSRAFEELWDHFARADAWRLYPDCAEALRLLDRAGIRLCVGSNFDARLRGVLAGLAGVETLADRVVISTEVGYRKPHAAFFQAACRTLGLPPAAVLAVGDEPESDCRGALEAGLRAVLVRRGASRAGDCPGLPDLLAVAHWLVEGRDWRSGPAAADR